MVARALGTTVAVSAHRDARRILGHNRILNIHIGYGQYQVLPYSSFVGEVRGHLSTGGSVQGSDWVSVGHGAGAAP